MEISFVYSTEEVVLLWLAIIFVSILFSIELLSMDMRRCLHSVSNAVFVWTELAPSVTNLLHFLTLQTNSDAFSKFLYDNYNIICKYCLPYLYNNSFFTPDVTSQLVYSKAVLVYGSSDTFYVFNESIFVLHSLPIDIQLPNFIWLFPWLYVTQYKKLLAVLNVFCVLCILDVLDWSWH